MDSAVLCLEPSDTVSVKTLQASVPNGDGTHGAHFCYSPCRVVMRKTDGKYQIQHDMGPDPWGGEREQGFIIFTFLKLNIKRFQSVRRTKRI